MKLLEPYLANKTLIIAVTFFTFFALLGSRSLNEPDEGRYAEIAREMIDTGNWIVPHLWYEPHLDKPPLTYWAVALSLCAFGLNEWAVRLPLALAGLSGVLAVALLTRAISGNKTAITAVLICQTMFLYYLMARMLTTDIFLTQFVAWAMFFFWKAWTSMDVQNQCVSPFNKNRVYIFVILGWMFVAAAFLTKGPVALLLILIPIFTLTLYSKNNLIKKFILPHILGFIIFILIITPWFLTVFVKVPGSFNYMVLGQAAGHLLGTTIKNRKGSIFYYLPILLLGLMPWTVLLSCFLKRTWWFSLPKINKDAFVFLITWAALPLLVFSLSAAKLPAYILPAFPAFAIMFAIFAFSDSAFTCKHQRAVQIILALSPFIMGLAVPITLIIAFKISTLSIWPSTALAIVGLTVLLCACSKINLERAFLIAFAVTQINYILWSHAAPSIETELKSNQTLKNIGQTLRTIWTPGDKIIICGQFPQGLPFYAWPVINSTNKPMFFALSTNSVPFESVGNYQRFYSQLIPSPSELNRIIEQPGTRKIIIAFGNTLKHEAFGKFKISPILTSGRWTLAILED